MLSAFRGRGEDPTQYLSACESKILPTVAILPADILAAEAANDKSERFEHNV
jgi:hypothetical protein